VERPRILVVDQDPGLREALVDAIGAWGAIVEGVAHAAAATARLGAGFAVDVVVLDMQVPDGQLLLRVLDEDPGLACVRVLGTTTAPEHERPDRPVTLLHKPFDLYQLLGAVEQVCAVEI
jgi:DNA-binding NtrC family response regulator